jgi:hypothetical protein|nr:MAG TPA: hypothetical protein [Caudoviricetes sp.]
MTDNFEENFYDVKPPQAVDPRPGLNALCRKTTRRIAQSRKNGKTTPAAEFLLRRYRDYACGNSD